MDRGKELGFVCEYEAESVERFRRFLSSVVEQVPEEFKVEFGKKIGPKFQEHVIKFSPFYLVVADRENYTTNLVIDHDAARWYIAAVADEIGIRFHMDNLLLV